MEIRNVLVTGAGGLVGRTLIPVLLDTYAVTCLDLMDPGLGQPFLAGDLRDADAVAAACQGMDAVIHVGALHGATWRQAGDPVGFDVNVVGTKNVLEAACLSGVKRVVFTSSIWATGHAPVPAPYLPIDEALPREPNELYGLTKKLGESMGSYYAATHGLSVLCLRPGGILPADAPPERRVSLLAGAVDVRDVAQAHLLALEAPDGMRFDTFVIVADSPLAEIERAAYADDPLGELGRRIPGLAQAVSEGTLRLPRITEWYTIARAKAMLGYSPRHSFDLTAYQGGQV